MWKLTVQLNCDTFSHSTSITFSHLYLIHFYFVHQSLDMRFLRFFISQFFSQDFFTHFDHQFTYLVLHFGQCRHFLRM